MTATIACDTGTLRRGACPSVTTPMQTGDGLLVRLRPVAAALMANDLAALADLARAQGNGLIEITARGNIQLRGLTEASVPRLAAGLAAASILPQTGVAIEVPPLSGIDPSETTDAVPLADALRAAIAEASLVLAPKLAVVVDGGGVLSLADMVADVRLDAVHDGWRLSLGGNRDTARPVAQLSAADAVAGTMTVLQALAARGSATRGRDLDTAALACTLGTSRMPEIGETAAAHPLGAHLIGGEIVLGLSPAYGQVHADRLQALVTDLAACGAFEFRLAPHRTILVRGLSADALDAARAAAEHAGFWSTDTAPGRSIAICAGAAGCASATFDTHAAADALVAQAGDLLDGSVSLHVSGCPKGCAHPAVASVTLCGTAAGAGLVLGGRAGDAPATTVPAGDLTAAIARLGALLHARRADGETARTLLARTAPAVLVSAYQGQQ